MGKIPIDLDRWAKCNGTPVWTKLESRGIPNEEVSGELLVQVNYAPIPQIIYESPLWLKRGAIKSKIKGKKSVYCVLYEPNELIVYRDITTSKELKRLCLKKGGTTISQPKADAMKIADSSLSKSMTLSGRECFMKEWWRALSPYTNTPVVPSAATNAKPNAGGKYYGRSLKDMVSDGIFGSDGVTIPPFLANLFAIVEKDGLDAEGIFRLSGAKLEIDNGVKAINGGKVFTESDNLGVHVASGLIKLFFRQLPEPLFTFELYSKFIDVANMTGPQEEVRCKINELVGQLPPVNRALTSTLMVHLAKVATHSDVNKMTPSNLAIVFAPGILWPKSQNALFTLTNLNSAQSVVEVLIVDAVEALAAKEEEKEKAAAAAKMTATTAAETAEKSDAAAAAATKQNVPLKKAGECLSSSQRMRRLAKIERKPTMLSCIVNNEKKARPAITIDNPVEEMETDPQGFEEKARTLFEGYDDDGNKFLDTDEFTLFFIDLIKVYSLSYLTRDDVLDIMEKISEGDMKITFEQFYAWWTDFNKNLQQD